MDHFEQGVEANENGELRDSCPHLYGSPERHAWLAGWDSFQPIREQLEAETHERACRYA